MRSLRCIALPVGEKETVEDLCKELRSPNEDRAIGAARELTQQRSPAAITALCWTIRRPGLVGQEASHALAAIGRPALSALIASLGSSSSTTRWHAAKALTEMAVPDSIPALIAALRDKDAGVRWEAVHALGAIGLPALAPLLRTLCAAELSVWLATGAQRVLRRLAPQAPTLHVETLIRLLDHTQAYIAVPVEAHRLSLLLPPQLASDAQDVRLLEAPARQPDGKGASL